MAVDWMDNPANMSDEELEREYKATQSAQLTELFFNPNVAQSIKDDIRQHCIDVEREYTFRRNEEWIYPLYEFGSFDFEES